MKKALDRFFESDVLMYTIPFVYLVCIAIDSIFMYMHDNFDTYTSVIRIMGAVLLEVIAVAYRKHEKNVMKGMMGAVLMAELLFALNDAVTDGLPTVNRVVYYLYLALAAVLFVNHFLLCSDHKAKPANLLVNQITALLLIAANTFKAVLNMSATGVAVGIINIIAGVCFALLIVCIESKVNSFKIAREANGYVAK